MRKLKQKRILLSGYYGFKNFGDDAILHVLVDDIKNSSKNLDITAISNETELICNNYDIKSIHRTDFLNIISTMSSADYFISGGGSLLQDVTSLYSLMYYLGLIFLAKLFGVKTFLYAQGIGPINTRIGRILTSFILKNIYQITVRDMESRIFLKNMGIDSVLTSDPVWRLECNNEIKAEDKKINVGIQLRDWVNLDETKLDSLVEAVNRNFDSNEHQLTVISLQDEQDLEISRLFVKKINNINSSFKTTIAEGLSICEAVNIISQLNYFIAMRFHANLISIKYNIPTLAVSYDPKVESLAIEADIPYILVENICTDKITEKIQKLISNKDNYISNLRKFSELKQQTSRQSFELLSKMIID
jgi:polysaccharide pyruvyl transferase CsaB